MLQAGNRFRRWRQDGLHGRPSGKRQQNPEPRPAQIYRRRCHFQRAGGNQRRRLASALLSAFGPSIGRYSRGRLHVSWFTLGRTESEAGIYYSVSTDDGKSFAPRRLVQANTAPETLYATLAVRGDDTIYLAWSNLDDSGKAQIYMRALVPDGQNWSSIQQVSRAKGNAGRPVLALMNDQLQVAWTETDGEDSGVVLRSATVAR